MQQQKRAEFEWRAPVGAWRWLILGSLGVAPYACGGRTDPYDPEGQAGSISNGGTNQGGSGGVGGYVPDTGGASGYGGVAGNGGVAGYGGTGGYAGSIGFGGSAGVSGSAGSTNHPSGCYADGVPLEGGFQGCTNGMRHRVTLGECSSDLPRENTSLPPEFLPQPDAGYYYECARDEDCSALPYGHCELGQGGPYCEYGCITDTDCGYGQLCLCDSPVGRCVTTDCQTDGDCALGLLCGSNASCGYTQFACQTRQDECAVNSDLCARQPVPAHGRQLRPDRPGRRRTASAGASDLPPAAHLRAQ